MCKKEKRARRVNLDLTGLAVAKALAKLLYIAKILIYNHFNIVINFSL